MLAFNTLPLMPMAQEMKKECDCSGLVKPLSQLLANLFGLYVKAWNFHWNFVGVGFNDRHAMYQNIKDSLSTDIDDVAERIRQLGAPAPGSLGEYAQSLAFPEAVPSLRGEDSIPELLQAFVAVVAAEKKLECVAVDTIYDPVTARLMQDLLAKHEKTIWFLTSNSNGM